jgi:hypothetical protein
MSFRTNDLTEAAACEARIVRGDGLRPNRALAERLAVVHRVAYELSIAAPNGEPVPLSPEEKLLRAIFGEAASGPNTDTPDIGKEIVRGDWLIGNSPAKVSFWDAATGVVEAVERKTSDLEEGIAERVTVIVRWSGPLTRGDGLRVGSGILGVVDAIVDDGDSDPKLYAQSLEGGARIERVLPTAAQRLFGRGIGPYDPRTRRPATGAVLRDDQLEWLAGSGGRALVGDIAAYALGEPMHSTHAYEALVKGAALDDPWVPPVVPESKEEGGR